MTGKGQGQASHKVQVPFGDALTRRQSKHKKADEMVKALMNETPKQLQLHAEQIKLLKKKHQGITG